MLPTLLFLALLQPAPDPLAPFAVYAGAWTVHSPKTMAGPGKPDRVENHCTKNLAFFSCEQVVNGKPLALIVFIPAGQPGRYYIQNVLPTGYSTGRGDLEIEGNHWTYKSKDVEGSKTTYYRTENLIIDHDHIHFEQSQSDNGTDWTKTNEGDEARAPLTP